MTVILLNFFLSHTCSYCHWPHRSRVYVTVGCTSVRHSVRLSIIRTPLLRVCCWAPGGVRHIERLLHGAPASAHAGSATLTADVWCWIQACFFLTERIGQQQYNGLLLKTCDRADLVCLVKWMSVYNQWSLLVRSPSFEVECITASISHCWPRKYPSPIFRVLVVYELRTRSV